MKFLEKILNNKIIQAASLAAGLLGTGIALKETLFSKPELRATVNAETKPIQQSNNIEDVKISIKNNEIDPEKEEILIRTITITNSGGDSILENYYDSGSTWGIEIDKSKIIKAIQSDTNKEYFKRKPLSINSERVEIPKYIIEPGEAITITTISIEPKDKKPKISIFGRIAKTKIIETVTQEQQEGTFAKATQGSLAVQLTRSIIYFFAFILLILVPASILSIIEDAFTTRRNKSLSKYLATTYKDKNATKIISELKKGNIKKIAWLHKEINLLSKDNLPLTVSILKLLTSNKNPPPELKRTVIPPFLALARNRGQAARANFCLGVMPPRAIFGLS